jgi:hypothetical protein
MYIIAIYLKLMTACAPVHAYTLKNLTYMNKCNNYMHHVVYYMVGIPL